MNKILCSRMGLLAALLVASLGAAACDSQGCGGEEVDTGSTQPPIVTCGPGTRLQAGQCVATEPIRTN